jgi:hypothetical protein
LASARERVIGAMIMRLGKSSAPTRKGSKMLVMEGSDLWKETRARRRALESC